MAIIGGYDFGKAWQNATQRAGNVFASGGGTLDAIGAALTPNRTREGDSLYNVLPQVTQQQQVQQTVNRPQPRPTTAAPAAPVAQPSVVRPAAPVAAAAPLTLAAPEQAYGTRPDQAPVQGAPSPLDLINQQFEQEQAQFNTLENQTQNQFGAATGGLDSQRQAVLEQLGVEQQNRRAGVERQAGAAREDVARQSAQQEAVLRQLLGDLQQRQISSMSAAGNFNSSVNDAANEAFSRRAFQGAQQVADARMTGERDIANQAANEVAKIEDFYARNRSDINNQYQTALQNLTAQRDQKLFAIAQARGASASARSANTAQAWNEYLAQKRAVDLAAFENAQALETWRQQKEFALEQARAYQANSVSAPKASFQFFTDATGNPISRGNRYTGQVESISGAAPGRTAPTGERALQVADEEDELLAELGL